MERDMFVHHEYHKETHRDVIWLLSSDYKKCSPFMPVPHGGQDVDLWKGFAKQLQKMINEIGEYEKNVVL